MSCQELNFFNWDVSISGRLISHKVLAPPRARILLVYVFLAFLVLLPRAGVGQPQQLTVGILASPPFVIVSDGEVTGLAIDLWEEIAEKKNWQFAYQEYRTFRDLIDATTQGQIDLALTNLTITQQRALKVDFTQPWFDGGVRLMVATEQGTGFRSVVKGLAQAGFITAYAWGRLCARKRPNRSQFSNPYRGHKCADQRSGYRHYCGCFST